MLYASPNESRYTLSGLSFGEAYNITIRAQVRFSWCYSYLYGEYSDELNVATVETGQLFEQIIACT